MSGEFIQFYEWWPLRQWSQIETTSGTIVLQLHFVYIQPISVSWFSDNVLSKLLTQYNPLLIISFEKSVIPPVVKTPSHFSQQL